MQLCRSYVPATQMERAIQARLCRYSEFQISYAIAIGGVSAIALLAHTQCGMGIL